jgi:hypothetical protein
MSMCEVIKKFKSQYLYPFLRSDNIKLYMIFLKCVHPIICFGIYLLNIWLIGSIILYK